MPTLDQYIVLWETKNELTGVSWRYSLTGARDFISGMDLASWILYSGHGVNSVDPGDLDASQLKELARS